MADIPELAPQDISADERVRHQGRLRSARHYAEKNATASTVAKWFKWLQSEADERDREVAQIALRNLGQASAKDELCRLVIETGNPSAQAIALESEIEPQDVTIRALFWFVTEQWPKYEALDFDGSLLRTAHQTANGTIKRRVAKIARDAGRMEWLGVVSDSHQLRRLADLSDEEWKTATEVLVRASRWPELWRLAQEASPKGSVTLLKALHECNADWFPDAEMTLSFDNLLQLASKCSDEQPPLVGLASVPVAVQQMTENVNCLAFTPDGQTLAVGFYGGIIKLLRVSDGSLLWEKKVCSHSVDRLMMTPNGEILVIACNDHIQLLRVSDGHRLMEIKKHARSHEFSTSSLAITPDGQTLVGSSYDGMIRWWNIADGSLVRTLSGIVKHIHCCALSSDGILAISGYERKTICLLNSSDGRLLQTLKGHKDNVESLTVTPDGKILISGSRDQTIRLWNLPDGRPLAMLEGHESPVVSLAVSSDGKFLLSGSGDHNHERLNRDHTIRMWQLSDGRLLKIIRGHKGFRGHKGSINCLAISSDGRVLASGGGYPDQTVRLWSFGELIAAIRVVEAPFARLGNEELDWGQRALRGSELNSEERHWLEFVVAMLLWRRRFEIEVSESPHHVSVGEFDIEIDG